MNKKTIFITFILLVLISAIFYPQISAKNKLADQTGFRIYDFETVTELTLGDISQFESPAQLNQTYSVDVTVGFSYELPTYYPKLIYGTKIEKWIMFRDPNHEMSVEIKLNVVEKPDWCEIQILDNVTIEGISTDKKEVTTKINITLNEDAEALQKELIKINAEFIPEANWGLLGSSAAKNFTLISEYIGEIQASFVLDDENTTEQILPPNSHTLLPISITNNYNGETQVDISVLMGDDEDWNISIEPSESIILARDETTVINLNITPPDSKKMHAKKLEVTINSKSTSALNIDEEYLQGDTIKLTGLELIKEKEEEPTDITTLLMIIAVIIIVLFIVTFLFKKYKK